MNLISIVSIPLYRQKIGVLKVFFLLEVIAATAIYLYLSRLAVFNIDWQTSFYPATRLLLAGDNPYKVAGFYNPVWALFPLIPLALLGERLGGTVLFFVAFNSFIYLAYRMQASPLAILAFVISPIFLLEMSLGNIDWLVLCGLFLPAPLAMLLFALKPQVSIGFVIWTIYFILTGPRKIQDMLIVFTPVTLLLILNTVLYGRWFVSAGGVVQAPWNMSIFPYGIPVFLYCLYKAIREQRAIPAMAVGPMLSPYVSMGTYSVFQLAFIRNDLITVSITAGAWLLAIFFLPR